MRKETHDIERFRSDLKKAGYHGIANMVSKEKNKNNLELFMSLGLKRLFKKEKDYIK